MIKFFKNFKPTLMQTFCILLFPTFISLAIILLYRYPEDVGSALFAFFAVFAAMIFYWEEEMKGLAAPQSDITNPADSLPSAFDSSDD